MRNRLLITGVSGFLGWNIYLNAKNKWDVHGTYFSNLVKASSLITYQIDLRDYNNLKDLFVHIKPDAVIHTAAASKPNFCQLNPQESYSINVDATVNIVRLCADYKIPCVFTSTDLVFDGKKSFYTEEDPISPICYYGEQKVIAENKILDIYPLTTICRMPLMFGSPSPVNESFLQGFIKKLKLGKELTLFIDEFRTPVSASTAANGLLLAINNKVNGLLHLGGKERISRYDFGLLLAEILSVSENLIKPIKQEDVVMAAPRSSDTSLNSNKAFSLGYEPQSIKEQLCN